LDIGIYMELPPHQPVLLNEVVEHFATEEKGYFIDVTLGYGGHSEAILEKSPNLHLIGIDRDRTAIEFSKKRLSKFGDRVTFYNGAFSEVIPEILEKYQPILGVLADIGVSSLQLDKLERGFSFDSENLDMRMDISQPLTAYDVVNSYPKQDLERILKEYGEIRNYKKLVSEIIKSRPIKSGRELAEIAIKLSKGRRGIHPATQLFQAIRIEVNDELGELMRLLDHLEKLEKAKIGIISFHSLEDKIVKNRFREWAKGCICPAENLRCECGGDNQLGYIVTKKPIEATKEEKERNRRSRSAKLRIFQKS